MCSSFLMHARCAHTHAHPSSFSRYIFFAIRSVCFSSREETDLYCTTTQTHARSLALIFMVILARLAFGSPDRLAWYLTHLCLAVGASSACSSVSSASDLKMKTRSFFFYLFFATLRRPIRVPDAHCCSALRGFGIQGDQGHHRRQARFDSAARV